MKATVGRSLLFLAIASVGLGADLPVTNTNTVAIPDIPQSGYLKSYIDPVFGAKVTRVTGDPGTDIPRINGQWNKVARHNYSKCAAWNCDQSILFLGQHQGYPSMLFLDGATSNPLFGRNTDPGTESRWHATDPDVMVYVKNNIIGYWDVRKDETQVVADFPGYSKFHIGPWEGNLSIDGKLIGIYAKKGNDCIGFAYDLEKKRKYPDIDFNNVKVDWISISASGKYIVLNDMSDRTQIYDLEGNRIGSLWSDSGRPSHYDLTLDEDGDDIAVGVSKSTQDAGRVIKRRLRDGKVTVLTTGGFASHTSTRNVKRPGWAYVTYQHRGPTWPPYWDEVVAVKLDGSMTVERIAHLHTKKTDYLTEAQAVPSPDGNRVLWASNWGASSERPIGTYVAERVTPKIDSGKHNRVPGSD